MTSIVLTISDEKLLPQLKKACMMLKGVTAVKVHRTSDDEQNITATAGYREAMKDIEKGRITRYDSLNDFFSEMGIR
ncbi:MAG: hypothetical protein IKP58_06310 [Victivallales bacterium]|nr:hypothetical protein [Victivallales bacterium]